MELSSEDRAKCMYLWLLTGEETEQWNGDACDCKFIQGNWNCKFNPY